MWTSKTIKIKKFPVSGELKNLYFTIDYEGNRIIRVWLHIGKGSRQEIADVEAIIGLVNVILEYGVDEYKYSDIIRTLSGIDSGIRYRYGEHTCTSVSDLIAEIIKQEVSYENKIKELGT
jgi:hypothetical protein